MKKVLLIFSLLFVQQGALFSQHIDTQAVLRQIDSLTLVSLAQEINQDPEYAKTLDELAGLYRSLNQHEMAISLYRQALGVLEKNPGKEHPEYGTILSKLAMVYSAIARYEEAEPLFLEALAIQEKTIGKENPHYVRTLDNLAILYGTTGQYGKAESFFLEANAIKEKMFGKESSAYAISLHNLGFLYYFMGQYEKTEAAYLESLSIKKKTIGTEHPDYSQTLANLAVLYGTMGQFEKSEALFLESFAIWERLGGKQNPLYATALNGLAELYRETGQYEKAIRILEEASTILENTRGRKHPDYARISSSLGQTYMIHGQYDKARPFILEAISIQEEILGKEHIDYLKSLNHLTGLYFFTGQYEKAKEVCLEMKTTQEKIFGKEHPENITLVNLAQIYQQLGQYEEAGQQFEEVAALNQSSLRRASNFLSERELSQYLLTLDNSLDKVFSFTQKAGEQSSTSGACFNSALFLKGFLLNASYQLRRLALSDPQTADKFALFQACHRQLAAELAKPITERKRVQELEEEANFLEKEIAKTTAGFGEALRQVSWEEVQSRLKPGECAIEFIHYQYQGTRPSDSIFYAALLLTPGSSQPEFVLLFEESELRRLVQASGERRFEYVNQLYGKPGPLADLLWRPLDQKLQGIRTIYFSPSGLLHQLNLGAIPISANEVLSDRYTLVQMGSTRQLVLPANPVKEDNTSASLFGGIRYEADSIGLASSPSLASGREKTGFRGELLFSYSDSTLRNESWPFLKWSEKEVAGISAILEKNGFKPALYNGYQATEEAFKQAGFSPRIIHLATHGFFFPNPKGGRRDLPFSFEGQTLPFKSSDHPLIRSGLILAGGNHAWKTGYPLKPEMEDGILTAYEISQLDLRGTELIALSACESGLGELRGYEGVYGLQRAFRIAGAKYILMSLWQVPDFQTQELMTAFYQNWLEKKMPIRQALLTAQEAMRKKGYEPYYWAGFVLVE